MADWTDAAVEAIAAWHSRWLGASSIRKRDRAYAREVLSVLSAAGRDYTAGVAEGRRLAAEAIRARAVQIESDPDQGSTGTARRAGRGIVAAYRNAARIAEEEGS